MSMQPHGDRRPVRVWDAPTRLFHWALVALVAVSVGTGKNGGLTAMEVHMVVGHAILALVLFRVVWGFVGSTHSRFADFVHGVPTVWRYARNLFGSGYRAPIGHNPMGGWVVVVILAVLTTQATTGLFANDDVFVEGPLAAKVTKETSDILTWVHHQAAHVMVILVGLHVVAALTYLLVKKENLILPMITGIKETVDARATEGRFASPWLAVAILGLAAAAVVAVFIS
jgi:cytochrome b